MNKKDVMNDTVTTLSIAIANHRQIPNENYVSSCLDRVNHIFKPQWIKHQVIIKIIYFQ